MENNLTIRREIFKNKQIQGKEFDVKVSQCSKVSFSINHHQDKENML